MKRTAWVMLMCAPLLLGACKKTDSGDEAGDKAKSEGKAGDPSARPTMERRARDMRVSTGADMGAAPRKTDAPRADASRAIAIPDKISIEVLDEGKGKKRKLRYRLAPGKTHTMVMELTMENRIQVKGRTVPFAMPKMRYKLSIQSKKGSKTGWWRLSIEGFTIEFPEPPTSARGKAIAAALQKAKGALEKMKLSYEMNARGFFQNFTFETPPDAPAPMQAILKQIGGSMKQSLMFTSTPLPEQAVGQGARWKAVIPVKLPMMKFVSHTTFAVKKIAGDQVTLSVEMKGQAPSQTMALPGGKGSMQLDKLDTQSSGSLTLNLQSPVPAGDMLTTTAMAGRAAGQSMAMTMKAKVSFAPAK